MKNTMSVIRVVPDIHSEHLDESREFYVGLLGFTVAMDMGWIMTLASPTHPAAQLTVMRHDASSQIVPHVTVQVADVDAIHAEAVRRGVPVVYPLTDEPWGVRRFFVRDPNGIVLNIMCHRPRRKKRNAERKR
jgi:catechol 2,3-dioxygenase-like lactoylglutathione lyase family enzyme